MKLLTIIASYDEARAPFATWIMRVARNAAIDHLRQLRMVPCEEVRRDGEADTVNCGSGDDRVSADAADHLSGCERVKRR